MTDILLKNSYLNTELKKRKTAGKTDDTSDCYSNGYYDVHNDVSSNEAEDRENTHDSETSERRTTKYHEKSLKLLDFFVYMHPRMSIFMLACIIYANSLAGDFLHDDNPAILRNKDVEGTNSFYNLWTNDFWGTSITSNTSHKSYRPLCVLFFRMEYYFFGFWPLPFRLTNVLMHGVVSVFVVSISKEIVFKHREKEQLPKEIISFLLGVLFALHPIHTEVVAGIVGRAELLSSFFFCASLLVYCTGVVDQVPKTPKVVVTPVSHLTQSNSLDFENTPGKIIQTTRIEVAEENASSSGWVVVTLFIVSLLLSLLAMLCKESGVTVLGIMLCIELLHLYDRRLKSRIYSHLFRIAVLSIWTITLLGVRMWVMDWTQPVFAEADNPASKSPNFRTRFLTYTYITWVNFKLLVYPVNLLYDWSYGTIPLITSWEDPRNVITFAFFVTVGCIFVCVICIQAYSDHILPLTYSILLLVLPYVPASNLFFPVGFVVAERVLYLPSIGYLLFLVIAWDEFHTKFPRFSRHLTLVIVLLACFYARETWIRNYDWISKESLFYSGVKVGPHNAKIRYNWANYLRDSRRSEEALNEYEETIKLHPTYAGALNNLAILLEKDPSTRRRAEEVYARLIRVEPWRTTAYKSLADLFMREKRHNAAVDVYMKLLEVGGSSVKTVMDLGDMFTEYNMTSFAERIYSRILFHYCVIVNDSDIMEALQSLSGKQLLTNNKESCINGIQYLSSVLRKYGKLLARRRMFKEAELMRKKSLDLIKGDKSQHN